MTGLSVIHVRRLLAILEEREMISRVMENFRRVEILVTWTPVKMHHPDAGGCIKTMQGGASSEPRGVHQDDAPDETTQETTEETNPGGCASPQESRPPLRLFDPSRPAPSRPAPVDPPRYPHPPRPQPVHVGGNPPTTLEQLRQVERDPDPERTAAMLARGWRNWGAAESPDRERSRSGPG